METFLRIVYYCLGIIVQYLTLRIMYIKEKNANNGHS